MSEGLARLAEIARRVPPERLASFAAQLGPEDLDVLERAIAQVSGGTWRADPLSFAIHLSGGTALSQVRRWRYVELLARKFRDAITGVSKRQLITLGTRYGKTEWMSKWGPAWALEHDPTLPIILCSYGKDLAVSNSVAVRDILLDNESSLSVRVRRDFRRQDLWRTSEGGGILAAGVGGRASGFPARLVVLDDPFKNWQEAHSEARRDLVWNFYRSVLRKRLEDEDSAVIIVTTRWHSDDIVGRLSDAAAAGDGEPFELVRLPTIADSVDDLIGRAIGEVLEPERFSVEAVEASRLAAGSYLFAALDQQLPAPEEGGEIKRAWWRIDDALPPRYDDMCTCLPAGTLVLTDGGPVSIEQVRVGDSVWSLSEDSKSMQLARVFQASCSGEDEILRFETNGRVLRCNARHRVLVRRKFVAPRSGPGGYKAVEWRTVWLPAGEITTADYLVAAHGLPDQLGEVAPNGRVLTEEFMAFAGLMIGDGSVLTNRVALARHPDAPYRDTYEQFAVREFRSARGATRRGIPRGTPIRATQPIRWSRARRNNGSFSSTSAARELRDLGFAGTAMTKRVPEWVFGLRPDLMLAFLRGYLDADGHVNARGHIQYASVNTLLLEDVRHLCMMLGIPTARVTTSPTAGPATILGRAVQRLDMHYLHLFDVEANRRIGSHHPTKTARLLAVRGVPGRGDVRVDRWSDDYVGTGSLGSRPGEKFVLDGGALVRVKRIVREPREPVYDLAVSGTHSFVADGVVVHNSVDTKLKDKETGDFVVAQVWGRTGSDYWCVDQLRGQYNFVTTQLAVALLAVRWPACRRHLIENSGNGPEVMESLRRPRPGYVVDDHAASLLGMTDGERRAVEAVCRRGLSGLIPVPPKGSKVARARAITPLIEAGNCHLPAGAPWVGGFLDEMASFPGGGRAHDDIVDAASQALSRLARSTASRVSRPKRRAPAPTTRGPGTGVVRAGAGERGSRPGGRRTARA